MLYDPKVVDFKDLCRLLFSRIDPSLKDQVGNDRGTQVYTSLRYIMYVCVDVCKMLSRTGSETTASSRHGPCTHRFICNLYLYTCKCIALEDLRHPGTPLPSPTASDRARKSRLADRARKSRLAATEPERVDWLRGQHRQRSRGQEEVKMKR